MHVAAARGRGGGGCVAARQRFCAESMSLKAMVRPTVRSPGPFVTLVRCRTVAKAVSIGLEVSYQDANDAVWQAPALHTPAVRSLTISMSQRRADDDAPADVAPSWELAAEAEAAARLRIANASTRPRRPWPAPHR